MSQEGVLLLVSFLTLLAAFLAALYGYRGDRRKSGIEIRGYYSIVSSIAAQDKYIGKIGLQNLKDRAVVIYAIYLEIGYGFYIEIEEFQEQPLVLGPFEAFQKKYEAMDMYTSGTRRIQIDRLLDNRRARKRLVLSTAQGRYKIKSRIARWNPIWDVFRNNLTGIVRPLRSKYKGKAYGSGTKYIVTLSTEGGREEVIPIYPMDHEIRKFRGFRLTIDALRSRDALEEFLLERVVAGELRCFDLAVFNLEDWRRTAYQEYGQGVIEAPRPQGWFTYNVLGWFVTQWEKYALRRRNRNNRLKNKSAMRAKSILKNEK